MDHGCRCEGLECSKHAVPTPGVFGNPPESCHYGAFTEGPALNASLAFTFVTFNLEGWAQQPHNVAKQAALLLSFNPDFIATQEDMYGWDMQRALGEGVYCFVGETREGRSCNPSCPLKLPLSSNGGDGEHTFIYFKRNVWQLLETGTYFLGWFEDGYPRIYTSALFQHAQTLQRIWVTSTHLPTKTAVNGQKICIQDLVTLGDTSRGMSIVLGDWNIDERDSFSDMYQPLRNNRFSFDTNHVCPSCRFCHDGYDKHFATFQGAEVKCDNSRPDLSDHYPVIGLYHI